MFFLFGFGHRSVKSYGSIPSDTCSRCHNLVGMDLIKITTWFTLFLIPVIPYKTDYLVVCPICQNGTCISKGEFEQIQNAMANGSQTNIPVMQVRGQNLNNQNDANKYAGKNEVQINYLKQMEELQNQQSNQM